MTNPVSNSPMQEIWSKVSPVVVPPIAASVAIIPAYYGFVAKSALQVGEPMPFMRVKVLFDGVKAAPTIGVIVGTQMVAQNFVEKGLVKVMGEKKASESSFALMLASSIVVGGVSAPALAVFNGQTMGQSAMKSLKMLSVLQIGAIVTRETSFLFSIRVSDPVSEMMKHYFGENSAVEYSATAVSGGIGSVIGHPADTALTLWQKGIKVENLRQLMRGACVKACAVGVFSIGYKMFSEIFNPKTK